jgi:hypothetical protein
LALYVGLAAVVGAVAAIVVAAGEERRPQTSIAGGYAVRAGEDCLGPTIQLAQSGRFVGLSNADRTLGGELELDGRRLSGGVDCVDGRSSELEATAANGRLSGTLDGRRVAAELREDPLAPAERQGGFPDSLEGEYELSPHSLCLGGELTVEGGSRV